MMLRSLKSCHACKSSPINHFLASAYLPPKEMCDEKRFARYLIRNESGRRLEKLGRIEEAIEQ